MNDELIAEYKKAIWDYNQEMKAWEEAYQELAKLRRNIHDKFALKRMDIQEKLGSEGWKQFVDSLLSSV